MKDRKALGGLQALVADVYRESIEEMRESGDYNAAILNGARQLLKDNGVISVSEEGSLLGSLSKELLPFDDPPEVREAMRQEG